MLAPTRKPDGTSFPLPEGALDSTSFRRGLGGGHRSRFERTVFYPANVCPARRTGEATAPARGVNRAMTGAVFQNAPRRADGLATSAVLEH